NSDTVMELYKTTALMYFYSGKPVEFRNVNQMDTVEHGLARLKKAFYDGELSVPESTSQAGSSSSMSDVNMQLSDSSDIEDLVLEAVVDEPDSSSGFI